MSGGSYNYLFEKVEEMAVQMRVNNKNIQSRQVFELRQAFSSHLSDVAYAMKAIEWVDSCDRGEGDEVAPILRVLRGNQNAFERKEIKDKNDTNNL